MATSSVTVPATTRSARRRHLAQDHRRLTTLGTPPTPGRGIDARAAQQGAKLSNSGVALRGRYLQHGWQ